MLVLETFEWRNYRGRNVERELASFVLKHAKRLKVATFSPLTSTQLDTTLEEKYRMITELARLPRGSTECELVFGWISFCIVRMKGRTIDKQTLSLDNIEKSFLCYAFLETLLLLHGKEIWDCKTELEYKWFIYLSFVSFPKTICSKKNSKFMFLFLCTLALKLWLFSVFFFIDLVV